MEHPIDQPAPVTAAGPAPLFTVFTPVFNRRVTLHRVWESLRAQSFRDFEWIVVDDGSTDGAIELLNDYRKQADFSTRIFRQANQGKYVAWRRAVDAARGELFVPADSDDAFVPHTLARFRELWLSIDPERRREFSGVNVLCADPDTGAVVGDAFPRSPMESDNLQLHFIHRVGGEKWGCIRTDVLREFAFPEALGEVAMTLPETYLWFRIARKYRVLCVNEALRHYYRDQADSLTASLARRFAAGPANHARFLYKAWHCSANLDYLVHDPNALARTVLDVWLSGLAAGHRPTAIMSAVRGRWPRLLVLLAALPALAFRALKSADTAGRSATPAIVPRQLQGILLGQ